jgi:hypothetical protein
MDAYHPSVASANPTDTAVAPAAPPASAAIVGLRNGRAGPVLFLLGFLLMGLGFLAQAWELYHYITPPGVTGVSYTQLQNQLFYWEILDSTLIGIGILVATAGWIVGERNRARRIGLQASGAGLPSMSGFVLAGLGAVLISGDEFFNAATTYAALEGTPWTLPGWIAFGAFTFAIEGAGLILIGIGWFVRRRGVSA